MGIITKIEDFLKENLNIIDRNEIENLFRKYDQLYKPEFDQTNHIKFHFGKDGWGGMNALRESLELIGSGEIIEKDENSLQYRELLENDIILFVDAQLTRSPYGGMIGYKYDIGVYKNDPRKHQIGGGYGSPGIDIITRTPIFGYDDYDRIHYNRNIISKICEYIKNKIDEKEY